MKFQRNGFHFFFLTIYKTIQAIQGKFIYFDQFSEDQHLPSLPPTQIRILTIRKVVTFNKDFLERSAPFQKRCYVPVFCGGKEHLPFVLRECLAYIERETCVSIQSKLHRKLTIVLFIYFIY